MGQISWHEVKKFAITIVWPFKLANVIFFPFGSKRGVFKIFAGIGCDKNVPPPGAAVACPAALAVVTPNTRRVAVVERVNIFFITGEE